MSPAQIDGIFIAIEERRDKVINQEQINKEWSESSDNYDGIIFDELNSFRPAASSLCHVLVRTCFRGFSFFRKGKIMLNFRSIISLNHHKYAIRQACRR